MLKYPSYENNSNRFGEETRRSSAYGFGISYVPIERGWHSFAPSNMSSSQWTLSDGISFKVTSSAISTVYPPYLSFNHNSSSYASLGTLSYDTPITIALEFGSSKTISAISFQLINAMVGFNTRLRMSDNGVNWKDEDPIDIGYSSENGKHPDENDVNGSLLYFNTTKNSSTVLNGNHHVIVKFNNNNSHKFYQLVFFLGTDEVSIEDFQFKRMMLYEYQTTTYSPMAFFPLSNNPNETHGLLSPCENAGLSYEYVNDIRACNFYYDSTNKPKLAYQAWFSANTGLCSIGFNIQFMNEIVSDNNIMVQNSYIIQKNELLFQLYYEVLEITESNETSYEIQIKCKVSDVYGIQRTYTITTLPYEDATENWHRIVWTTSNSSCSIYIDGKNVFQNSILNPFLNDFQNPIIFGKSNNMFRINNLCIYDHSLSTTEIKRDHIAFSNNISN